MSSIPVPNFVILVVLDGWGLAHANAGNAVRLANTVNINKFKASYPNTQLLASGESVGLPHGEDGNTETGHINLGAGRIVYQDLERINMSIADGRFFSNSTFEKCFDHVIKNNSDLHIMGLVGAGGVHSNLNHLFALINFANTKKINNLFIHAFTDGRDSPPTSAKTYLLNIQDKISNLKFAKIASVMGRYWAMDRDQRWDRTQKAYDCLVHGKGNVFNSYEEIIDLSYKEGKTDEFIEPSLINNEGVHTIKDNDAVIFFNFRIDRPRQLTKAFVFKDFSKANLVFDSDPFKKIPEKTVAGKTFDRGNKLNNLFFVTMTDYGKSITQEGAFAAFPPEIVNNPLSLVLSQNGHAQLKVTESEKERFVTFYFNGMHEKPFPLEDRIIISSPKVATYDQKPEMSSAEITQTLISKIAQNYYKFIFVNYPNPDMVGHTGNIGPAVRAIEVVDDCMGKLATQVITHNGALLITADHGNAEEMINLQTNQIDTEHSSNPVPFLCIYRPLLGKPIQLRSGILADVAPTALSLLGIQTPIDMTGRDLLKELDNVM